MKFRPHSIFNLVTLIALLTSLVGGAVDVSPARAVGRCYVNDNASGGNTGANWVNAYTSLQSAITDSCTEIWVAAGVYKPHASDRAVSFVLENGTAIYGGFAGTETLATERDPVANIAILSGDIDGNDTNSDLNNIAETTANIQGSNSYHVVTGVTGATLDGFTITAGQANSGSSPNDRGGGIYNNSSSPTLTNLTLIGNTATYGGGMQNDSNSSPTLTNITFSANSAANGGGMQNNTDSSPTLTNVTFSDNSATSNGGGMFNYSNSNPTLTNVTFSANSATSKGGGMYNLATSSPNLTNVTFSSNSAGNGGGMLNEQSSAPTLKNVILWSNTGGEISNLSSTPLVSYSIVQGGYAGGTNIITTDPNLSALALNGGTTKSHALQAGSSAIDVGTNTGCPGTDQRGVTRPQNTTCDIGAYEYDSAAPTVTSIARTNTSPTSLTSVGFTVTFSEPVTGVDVDTSDFALDTTGMTGASIDSVSGSGASYLVTVSTGTGSSGTVSIDLIDDATIIDVSSIPLSGGNYTAGEAYVIDRLNPTASWNSFTGGTASDTGKAIAVDGSGNTYITGDTNSSWGSPVRAYTAGTQVADAFVAKVDSSGALVWNTFLGGDKWDYGRAVAFDSGGNLYVMGETQGSGGGWTCGTCTVINAYAAADTFLAKVNPATGEIIWLTFMGSASEYDNGYAMAVDSSGNIYVGGASYNDTWGSPVRAHAGNYYNDGFVAKFNSSGALQWNTFLGASDDDQVYGLAAYGGKVYAMGISWASWGDTITRAYSGSQDGFIAELSASTGALGWNAFLGGVNNDEANYATTDSSGNIYVTGEGYSDWGSPVRARNINLDAFVVKLNSSGGVQWNTFLGTSGNDYGTAIVYNGSKLYVAGKSQNSWETPWRAYVADYDGFLAVVDSAAGVLDSNAFFGGSGSDAANGVAVDANGSVYLAGGSSATWGSPSVARAFNAVNDAFVAKLAWPLTALSIARANISPTSLASVGFNVTFSKPVTGVDTGDFALDTTGMTGASITGISGSGSSYIVTVNTGTGTSGTVSIDLIDNASIIDGSSTALSGGNYTTGEAYTINRSAAVLPDEVQAYLKASNTGTGDYFGYSIAIDGDTMVVGAPYEWSDTTGVNSTPNEAAADSGAVYVFVRSGGVWTQQAYLKASNTGANDYFGFSVAISGDTIVVGASGEDSNATGINNNQADNSAVDSGAAYVFTRSGITWSQQAYLKASNTEAGDTFGMSVAISGDTIVVGSYLEDSTATDVNGNQANNSALQSGAAYAFARSGVTWTQQAYLKASNTGAGDFFGWSVTVSGDTIVIGANYEDSNTTGVNSTPNDSALDSGAAYVFKRSGITWSQQAYLKASNTSANGYFGWSVAISGDTIVAGAKGESSGAGGSGAAYVFTRSGAAWSQQAYLKASNAEVNDYFGYSVAISGDMLVVSAVREDSSTTGINSTPNNSAVESGAAYVFTRSSGTTWSQQAYLKASNTEVSDEFGISVAVSAGTVIVGADMEASAATGVNGNQADNSAPQSGAAYVYAYSAPTVTSITRTNTSPTSLTSVGFTVTFSKSVTGVDTGDFALDTTGMTGASITGISGSGSSYIVTVNTGTGTSGTVSLDLIDDSSIIGGSSTPLSGGNFTSGEVYTINRTPTSLPNDLETYLKASDSKTEYNFGSAVDMDGNTLAVAACNEPGGPTYEGAVYIFVRNSGIWSQQAKLKASNAEDGDNFACGFSNSYDSAISLDGDTLVVGATMEDGNGTSQGNNSMSSAGAVYVFTRSGSAWSQQAYLKASTPDAGDYFGWSVDVSSDTLVVGAPSEDSNATGINGNQADNSANSTGAAYVFTRSGSVWTQQSYLKASNSEGGDWFGNSIAIDGNTVIVGSYFEDSNGSSQGDNSANNSGAAYVFSRSGTTWAQQAYLKSSFPYDGYQFGNAVDISGDTVVIGSNYEKSTAVGVNGDDSIVAAETTGAAFVFTRAGTVWNQQAYLKASNTDPLQSDMFGTSVAIDGDAIAIGAIYESSDATGLGGNQASNASNRSGAAYMFTRANGTTWSQSRYIKASNTGADDNFGMGVTVSGGTVAVGAWNEESNATGINGNQADNSVSWAGAAYVYTYVPPPTVSSITRMNTSPTALNSVGFKVTFSKSVTGVNAADFAATTIGLSGASVASVSGSGASYIIKVNTGTGSSGTVQLDLINDSSIKDVSNSPLSSGYSSAISGDVYTITRAALLLPNVQQSYLKAFDTNVEDGFGEKLALDGDTLVVGSLYEDSSAAGIDGDYADNTLTESGAVFTYMRSGPGWSQGAYIKASNPGADDCFGCAIAINGDTLVVGAPFEDGSAIGVNPASDEAAPNSGAVYVFVRNGGVWTQQAYLKASNTGSNDMFGYSVAISGDTIVVGALGEDSIVTGVNGNGTDNLQNSAGAAYVFTRTGGLNGTWAASAYLKASNANVDANGQFGSAVAVSGNTIVVGAKGEGSNANGVNGNQTDVSASSAGAAYVFTYSGVAWSQQAYLKASNSDANDYFGDDVAISGDTIIVGAWGEASSTIANQADNSVSGSGAAYIFTRSGITWAQQKYLKAPSAVNANEFGSSVGISGEAIVIGASNEGSNATGVNGNQADTSASGAGAAFIFARSGGATWSMQKYLKASNTESGDVFGRSVAISGSVVAAGADFEDSNAIGANGDQADNSASNAGAVYVFNNNTSSLTFTVNSILDIADAGIGDGVCATAGAVCTLRAAIQETNAHYGADTINFNISGGGVKTITLVSNLPHLEDTVTINGYTQPEASANTMADGSNAALRIVVNGNNTTGVGLYIHSSNTIVKGLTINNVWIGGHSIYIESASNVKIAGNYIGTNATGLVVEGNALSGVYIVGNSLDTIIGGSNPADHNVISGNDKGILLYGSGVSGTVIKGNYIGVGSDGVTSIPNTINGIEISNLSFSTHPANTIIGGTNAGEGNIIANSGTQAGVQMNSGYRNLIIGNSIYNNAGAGIHLSSVTTNDTDDADTTSGNSVSNEGQNYPVISSASVSSGDLTVSYSIDSTIINSAYPIAIDFYKADSNTSREGKVYLGRKTIAAPGTFTNQNLGNAASLEFSVGDYLVATATDANGNTSVFSAAFIGTDASTPIVVNDTTDELNSDSDCSLREAIQAANTNAAVDACSAGSSGANIITVPAGIYTLSISGTDNTNDAGDLDITESLTINGAGANFTTIQAGSNASNSIDRVFHVIGGITFNLNGVKVQNGLTTSQGGGIESFYSGSVVNVANSIFSGNSASVGGAIDNAATLTVTNTSFFSNTSTGNGGGAIGNSNSGTATISRSLFSGNSAANYGGAIENYGNLTISNTTFSGNTSSAPAKGGGVVTENFGTTTIINSTISGSAGHGVFNRSGATLHLKNTIIANTTGIDAVDCQNETNGTTTIATNTNNLIENTGPAGFQCGTPALTADPGLSALANHGGQTQTFAIDTSSPAFNAGSNTACTATDQRGISRPRGAVCDIGAYEVQINTFTVTNTNDSGAGSLRQALLNANSISNTVFGPDYISVASTFTPDSIAALSALPVITQPVYINGDNKLTLNGSGAGTAADGLTLNTSGSTITGMTVTGFTGAGVVVADNVANTENQIIKNSIYANGILDLDLGDDGIALNHDDTVLGPNKYQNYPVLELATTNGSSLRLMGSLDSAPGNYTIHVYSNESCHSTYFGGGKTYLGSFLVTTNVSGVADFDTVINSVNVPEPYGISTTATGSNGTSEFSYCRPVSTKNLNWVNAQTASSGVEIQQNITDTDQEKWFKFTVHPDEKVHIELTDIEDGVLTLHTDPNLIYDALINPSDEAALSAQSSGAAFLPSRSLPSRSLPSRSLPSRSLPSRSLPSRSLPSRSLPSGSLPSGALPSRSLPSRSLPSRSLPSQLPDAYANAALESVIDVSMNPYVATQVIDRNVYDYQGDLYIRVAGGYDIQKAFKLKVTITPGLCSSVNPITASAVISGGASSGSYKTLILTDSSRLSGSPAQIAKAKADLQTLANRAEVGGVVIDLSEAKYQRVAQANAQADANLACVPAKNMVADEIKSVVAEYRAANPSLEYIVLAGGANVIPYFQVADVAGLANEKDYIVPVKPLTASEAGLKSNKVQGQDGYGSQKNITQNGITLAYPDLAVGRLVDTAADISITVAAYIATGGEIAPDSSLVTGYDFVGDAAEAIKTEMDAGTSSVADTLIQAPGLPPTDPTAWTANQLRAKLLTDNNDIVVLTGHFSAGTLLAADYDTQMSASEIMLSSGTFFTDDLILTLGCHGGYTIPSSDLFSASPNPDWAKAFMRKGAAGYIAATGYAYGDTELTEYGERLFVLVSKQLRTGTGPISIGQAMMKAKQQYLADTAQITGIDQKTIIEMTLYGLPMMKVNMPGARITPGSHTSAVPSTSAVASGPGAALGLGRAPLALSPTLGTQNKVVESVTTTYLTGADGVVANPFEPILPKQIEDVNVDNEILRGVAFRGGVYTDQTGITPLTTAPATELSAVHGSFNSEVFYPSQMWMANYYDAINGGRTRLVVFPAQYKSSAPGASDGTLRMYSSLDLKLYYLPDDWASDPAVQDAGVGVAPNILGVSADEDNAGVVTFSVNASADGSAGVQEVWVVYTGETGTPYHGAWTPLDLIQDAEDATLWTGTLDLTELGASAEDVRFMVQAVGGAGLTTLDTHLGAYYTATAYSEVPSAPADASVLSFVSPPTSGVYGHVSNFTVLLTDGTNPVEGKLVVLDFGGQQAFGTTAANGEAAISMEIGIAPGDYTAQASFRGDSDYLSSTVSSAFAVNKDSTSINILQDSGQIIIDNGNTFMVELKDSLGRPLGEKSIFFVLHNQRNIYTRSVITDYQGKARLGAISMSSGSYKVDVYFNGIISLNAVSSVTLSDDYYESSSALNNLLTLTPAFSSASVNDGWTLESKETSNIANTKMNTGDLRVGDDAKNRQYRSLLYFDTASIPNNAIVTKAVLKIKVAGTTEINPNSNPSTDDPFSTHGNLVADMKKGFFGRALLEVGDFSALAAPINTAGKFTPSTPLPGDWVTLTLSPANFKYINLIGATQFRIRFTKDDNNDKNADYISFFAGEGNADAPQFIIEYNIP